MNAKFSLAIALAAGLLAAELPHIFHAGEGGVEAFVLGQGF